MNQDNSDLRRAAILVASLDRQTADELLDALPTTQATEIRHAILSLSEIDSVEQEMVIRQFLDGEVEREGLAPRAKTTPTAPVKPATATVEPATATLATPIDQQTKKPSNLHEFRIGHDFSVERLSRLLQHEQPLTIAACLSRVTPTQAAAIVRNLPRDIRGKVLKRTVDFQSADPEAMVEIELELNQLLRQDIEKQTRTSDGINRLWAMLQHLNSSDRQMLVDDLARQDHHLAIQLNRTIAQENAQESAQNSNEVAVPPINPPPTPSGPLVGLEFHDLRLTDAATLAEIFQDCDFETAALALAGATESLASELLGRLPVGIARRLRQRLADPGPIRLRDITLAQDTLVQMAQQLHLQSTVRGTLTDHRFIATA